MLPAGASPHTSQEAPAWDRRGCPGSANSPSSGGGPGLHVHPGSPGSGPLLSEVVPLPEESSLIRSSSLLYTFSFPRAHSQALSQVRPRSGHRTVDMFLGTQLQSSCFHREEREERKAPNDHQAGSENEPLSALSQLWTQGLASASQLVNGAAGKVQSQGGRVSHAKVKMQKHPKTHERAGTLKP